MQGTTTPPQGTPIVTPPPQGTNTQPLPPTPPPAPDPNASPPPAPTTPPPTSAPPPPNASTNTGPLDGVRSWFSNLLSGNGRAHATSNPPPSTSQPPTQGPPPKERSAIEKMRDSVAEMDEDYKGMGDRILGLFMQVVGYVGPFVIVVGVGTDLGKFYAPVWGDFSSLLIAYVLECVIAGCTIAMGRAFEEISSGKAAWGKVIGTVGVWLVLNISSALGLYWQAKAGGLFKDDNGAMFQLMVRVSAIALSDLGCSIVLMWKGKSLQRHIDSIKKRASAITELADAQRSTDEADKNAMLRDKQMQSSLKMQEELTNKIGDAVSMVMNNILDRMDKALKDGDTKNERGYGKH